MKLRLVLLLGACGLVAACAASPESIQPAYVSPITYQHWSCGQLAEEEGRLRADYVVAASQQNDAHMADNVGVLIIGMPVGSMAGEDVAPRVAQLKGQLDALHEALGKCGGQPSPYADIRSYGDTSEEQQFQSFNRWQKNQGENSAPH